MTTGRINQVARPHATPSARPRAVPALAVRAAATRRRSFARRAGGPRGETEAAGEAEAPRRAVSVSPLGRPTRFESCRGAQCPALNRFHRVRRARDGPEDRPTRQRPAGGRTGRRTRTAPSRRPPGGAAEGADVRLSSGPEFAAFRLRRTDRADRARSGRGWRETNGARRTPAVGCTRQGFPRTPRAECRSRAVAAARRAGSAPRRADPRRDPPAETGEAMARRADVARVVPSEGKLAPQRDGDAQARRDFSPGIGGAPCANPSRPILLHEAYAAGWPLAARLLPGGTSGRAGRRRTSWRRPLPRCWDGRPAPEGADRRICATPTSERFRQSGVRPEQQRGAGAFCRAARGASASSRGSERRPTPPIYPRRRAPHPRKGCAKTAIRRACARAGSGSARFRARGWGARRPRR